MCIRCGEFVAASNDAGIPLRYTVCAVGAGSSLLPGTRTSSLGASTGTCILACKSVHKKQSESGMACRGTQVCAHISVSPFCLQVSNYTTDWWMHTASAVLVWQQHALPVTELPMNNPVLCCFLHVLCNNLRALSLCMCRDQHLQHLFSAKKLLLVLDLDHTLLSSTRMADLPEEMLPKAEALLSEHKPGRQLLFKLPHMWMWTKLRPGIHKFLAEAHKLFELHIYTHGDQDYAAEMAKLLDPKRTLFGGRVISAVRLQPFHICLYNKSSIKFYQQTLLARI